MREGSFCQSHAKNLPFLTPVISEIADTGILCTSEIRQQRPFMREIEKQVTFEQTTNAPKPWPTTCNSEWAAHPAPSTVRNSRHRRHSDLLPVLLQDALFPAHSGFKKKIKGDLHYHYKLVPTQQHRTDDTLTVMSHEAKFPSRERHCLHYSTPWKRVNHYEETLCQTLADSLFRDYIFPYMINPG